MAESGNFYGSLQADDLSKYSVKKTNPIAKILIYILLAVWTLVNLFPIYWMISFSLKEEDEVFSNKFGLPKIWDWENYRQAFKYLHLRYFLNSIIIAVVTIAITLLVAMMATYAITRIKWRGSKLMYKFFMLGLTIPLHVAIVPLFKFMAAFKGVTGIALTNRYIALIVPYSAFALAMAILICVGFMDEIPHDLDESAYIDGCGLWKTFFKIIIPLMKPAVATIGIYTFIQCWNELLYANIFNGGNETKTLPTAVYELSTGLTIEWGPYGAALVVATLPILIVYIFLSRRIQESFMAGAVKG